MRYYAFLLCANMLLAIVVAIEIVVFWILPQKYTIQSFIIIGICLLDFVYSMVQLNTYRKKK